MITGNIILCTYFIGGVAVGLLMRATASWPRLGVWAALVSTYLIIGLEVVK